jgi:hypothetical protein
MRVDYRDDAHLDKMGWVLDISKSGMYVQTGYFPEENGHLVASLDDEDFGKVIWVEGRIVWKSRTGIAVTFTNTDSVGLSNLLTYRSVPF